MPWREVLVGDGRARLSAGLVLMEFLAGIQFLVVTSVMPRVVGEIGGIEFYGAVFAGYMLAGLVSIPRSGHQADQSGPARPFAWMIAVFCAGAVVAGLAPNMPVLVVGRLVQGYGGGAMYSLAYGVVAKAYPDRARARMVALLTAVWVVSGLIGPSYGALLSTSLTWRLTFVSVIPLAALTAVLVVPALRSVRGIGGELGKMPMRWPLQLGVGSVLLVAGFSAPSWLGGAAVLAGAALVVSSLGHVLPPGTVRGRPGLPAAVAAAFLLSLSFFTADSFVPLLLTGVRGRSVAEASIAVTLVSVSWSVGTVWQAQAVERYSLASLMRWGSVVLTIGTAGFAAALLAAPLWLAYLSWTVAGVGMGIAFPTVFLAAVNSAGAGREASAVSARFVSGRVGIVLGTGLGGFSVALAHTLKAPLSIGLAGAFAIALLGAALSVVLAPLLKAETIGAGGERS
jgi:MFS family permease